MNHGVPMHRGYSTTSSLRNKQAEVSEPQKNATWGEEPIIGEVTGSKMRRLLSNNSYFHSHPTPPPPGAGGSQNATWGAPKPPRGPGNRSAMQNLLNSNSYVPTARTNPTSDASSAGSNAAWPPIPKPAVAQVTVEDMQRLAASFNPFLSSPPQVGAPTQGGNQNSTCPNPFLPSPQVGAPTQGGNQNSTRPNPFLPSQAPAAGQSTNAAWPTPKPSLGQVTVEDMQRLAASHNPFLPSPAVPAVSQSQNAAWPTPKPALGKITVEEMQRLATHKPFLASPTTAPSQSASQNAALLSPKPTPAPIKGGGLASDFGGKITHLVSNNSVPSHQEMAPDVPPVGQQNDDWPDPASDKVSGGTTLQRFMSTNSYFKPDETAGRGDGKNADWPDPETLETPEDPDAVMVKLRALMDKSSMTQKALQGWDKDNGLPRSHSQTMVNSSRSRKQLLEGKIIPKWDGTPLINNETELGKPKPRAPSKKG